MEENFILIIKKQFDFSYSMLKKVIDNCPDDLWNSRKGGFVFFQQILHTLCGINYWMRINDGNFVEPFSDRLLHPELEDDPEGLLTKQEMHDYLIDIDKMVYEYFKVINSDRLLNKSMINNNITNLDIILMQIRHIQYHVGHCNSIFRENNIKAVEWIDEI